ncbi:hypothetical protein [Acanthopleuribacter pedis]|uniref:Uncharacterized protein n=1 Tax=Acanthopleuribacter pedis TaxID=442870 RepID=A0A8J7U5B5_9BACT|nr:hypothetical protein [Acanthopleuribacter pedis]MBO1321557.1 hypothetical protein [Acanthopleuribacter pedis]
MSRDYAAYTEDFEAGRIAAETFTHVDHLGVAWDMLGRYDFLTAAAHYATGIQQLATRAGVPEKANLTITLAFLSLIAERRITSPAKSFETFLSANPDLCDRNPLRHWYTPERLNTPLARTVFLLPHQDKGLTPDFP